MRNKKHLDIQAVECANCEDLIYVGDSCLKIDGLFYCMDLVCYIHGGGNDEAEFNEQIDKFGTWIYLADLTPPTVDNPQEPR